MTAQDAKRTKIGARVKWESSGEYGTITEKGAAGIRVAWNDGTEAIYLYAVTSSGLLHLVAVSQ